MGEGDRGSGDPVEPPELKTGLRMPEIPFPRTSMLKLFQGRMPPDSQTGDRVPWSVSRTVLSKFLYSPSLVQ